VSAARLLACALLLTLAACGARPEERPPLPVRVLAVLPFETAAAADQGTRRGELTPGDVVTAQLYRVLAEQTEFDVVPDLTVVDTLGTPELRRAIGQLDRAVALGKALGAEAVLVGRVTRFRERVGTAYGASQGASVGVEMGLVSVAAGELVWQGEFEDTQEALSSNLFDWWMFWDAGPRWLTAAELAGLGVEQLWPQAHGAMTMPE
jgi:hypothetical protein